MRSLETSKSFPNFNKTNSHRSVIYEVDLGWRPLGEDLLQEFGFQIMSKIISQIDNLPYSLRWYAKRIVQLIQKKSPQDFNPKYVNEVLKEIVIETFIFQGILRPELFGIASGFTIGPVGRNNLIQVLKKFVQFIFLTFY